MIIKNKTAVLRSRTRDHCEFFWLIFCGLTVLHCALSQGKVCSTFLSISEKNRKNKIFVYKLIQDCDENRERGFELLEMASEAGDRNSIFIVAKAYHTGVGLPKSK